MTWRAVVGTIAALGQLSGYRDTSARRLRALGREGHHRRRRRRQPDTHIARQLLGHEVIDLPIIPLTVIATFIPPPDQEPRPVRTRSEAGPADWARSTTTSALRRARQPRRCFTCTCTEPARWLARGRRLHRFGDRAGRRARGGSRTAEPILMDIPKPAAPRAGAGEDQMHDGRPPNRGRHPSAGATEVVTKLAEHVCEPCVRRVQGVQQHRHVRRDPQHNTADILYKSRPTPNYQEIAEPDPPPVLPDHGAFSPRSSAIRTSNPALATRSDISARYTTINRVRGAANANSRYWYLRQMDAMHDDAAAIADELGTLAAVRWHSKPRSPPRSRSSR